MSGHSKWSTIKRKKAKVDAKRGKLFTKAIKEIQVAARVGGGDPEANPRLRTAVLAAKAINMPLDNIDRAIKKAVGELGGVEYEQITYEGYGPGGVAVFVETLTDNKNRTVGEVRHLFSKYGGNMGESGCVGWMFNRRGIIALDAAKADEDQVIEIALEAGAIDVSNEDGTLEVLTDPFKVEEVRQVLEAAGMPIESAEVTMVPQNTVSIEGKQAESCLKMIELLEDNDDVQNVYTNADIPEDLLDDD
ncbi:MAG: YebC/PmpR family DNA-binding transcriptional regulator [Candidatus Omnitrophica bacterium]|nr:MAG: putative transcriptional regulatory protein [Candidatus Hinthialibacteria bacterium OLB16]MBE7487822.1 YebC/PmpR family DNA-binding transcriptional regulator [bacterium]MBK7497004.1 YebC/PmpR family DNA-binding transcriptional regulator [Candidatus Omnitrophota bacterium]MCE7908590.1 YebC/PmpR family DNA-binding transcriptional regulator [Candidatus Omnitrophica bacterium COP1]MBV6482007.1 putative transcriptional regulatory protein [bacterium]